MLTDRELRSEMVAALEAVTPPAPWLAASIEKAWSPDQRVRRRSSVRRGLRASLRVVAVAVLIAFLVSTTAVFLATHPAIFRNVPAHQPHGVAGVAPFPVIDESYLSANDAAVDVNTSTSDPRAAELDITHDGGKTWIRTGITAWRPEVFWFGPEHIVVEYGDTTSPVGVALKATDDGGYHWRTMVVASPDGGPWIGGVFLMTPTEAWGEFCKASECGPGSPPSSVPSTESVFYSGDSGATWQKREYPRLPANVSEGGPYFTDSKHGFMGTVSSDGVQRIVVTHDGGVSWTVVTLPAPPGGWPAGLGGPPTDEGCNIDTCSFVPAMFGDQGVLVVNRGVWTPWFTYTTTDGGFTWGNPRPLPAASFRKGLDPWDGALDMQNWWWVDSGALYRSVDGGATWHVARPKMPSGYGLAYVKPVGGGILWGSAALEPHGDCNVGPQDCYAVRSSDNGSTWTMVKLPG